jgi:hypothetical protein
MLFRYTLDILWPVIWNNNVWKYKAIKDGFLAILQECIKLKATYIV